jgi:hypothetical protein
MNDDQLRRWFVLRYVILRYGTHMNDNQVKELVAEGLRLWRLILGEVPL